MSSITLEGKEAEDYILNAREYGRKIKELEETVSKLLSEKYSYVYEVVGSDRIRSKYEFKGDKSDLLNSTRKQRDTLTKDIARTHKELKQLKNRTLIQRIFRKYER